MASIYLFRIKFSSDFSLSSFRDRTFDGISKYGYSELMYAKVPSPTLAAILLDTIYDVHLKQHLSQDYLQRIRIYKTKEDCESENRLPLDTHLADAGILPGSTLFLSILPPPIELVFKELQSEINKKSPSDTAKNRDRLFNLEAVCTGERGRRAPPLWLAIPAFNAFLKDFSDAELPFADDVIDLVIEKDAKSKLLQEADEKEEKWNARTEKLLSEIFKIGSLIFRKVIFRFNNQFGWVCYLIMHIH